MPREVEGTLAEFSASAGIRGKGPLSVVIQITDKAMTAGLPLDPDRLLTAQGGQVEGLGGDNLARILARYDVMQTLSREGGRTSRGSMKTMRSYVLCLNQIAAHGSLDLELVMRFWIGRVRAHFAAKPLRLDIDPSLSVQAIIGRLVRQAEARQRETPGSTLVGTMVQHLVGAKLDLLGVGAVAHHSASTNDAVQRGGDFDLGDTTVHVTTAPSEALMSKCRDNLADGRRPLIVTSGARLAAAHALAEDAGLGERIDVIDYAQFLAANVFELGRFAADGRRAAFSRLVERYNAVIEQTEGDPSLLIALR